MKQALSYIMPTVSFIANALSHYNGRITDTGTQIMWGAVLFLALVLLLVHRVYRKRASGQEGNALSLRTRAGRFAIKLT
ncbi:MAG: hypothetical protein M1517_07090, partial [Deltaproteobacteria bacterium]|nr:hypothetical protein [Deltaproteobacteria bacterium]